ncbi:DUF4381 domain-containing protein [Reinekea sp.]|uniref:DUF4381 domain-containing protein n=1 Tax=Reinekea sp. TaxID=1970455 RepID=UPI002A7F5EA6|nr:DUF4381 domain-containing protein [Reinekea sp.]
MASVSLMPEENPALQQLLAQLASNVLPSEPSVWPLALGYWLVLSAVIIASGALFYWWHLGRDWRRVSRQRNNIQAQNDPAQQALHLHQLLRWVLINKLGAEKGLTDQAFAERVATSLVSPAPAWLNAHYRALPAVHSIDWAEVQYLLKAWRKEAKR